MDVFDTLASGQLDELGAALAAEPWLARLRHASGASLLAWAYYVGRPDAAAIVRPHLQALDPYDGIIDGDIAAVRRGLDDGWDGNAFSPDGFTPLGLAAFFNRPDIFDLLLPLTRNVNEAAKNRQKVAALHAATAARNADMVDLLLRAGADPNQPQADDVTPLHAAALHGDAAIAGMLILFGADPSLRDAKGRDAVAHARGSGHDWLAERLSALAPR